MCLTTEPSTPGEIALFRRASRTFWAWSVVAVEPPSEKVSLAQMLCVEGGARTADPYFLQVCREPDCAVMSICPRWITQHLPHGPEPELQDLSRRR